MASSITIDEEETIEFPPLGIRVFKSGRVERRLKGPNIVQPSTNPITGVQSKDVTIISETGLSARLYIPKTTSNHHKLPILVYFHGGGFCLGTAFSTVYHDYLNSLVAESSVVVVSVDYRLAPEHPLPIAYDDSWDAIKWIASHSTGNGHEVWLNNYVDFNKMFFAGESAGANIAHNMAIRVGSEGLLLLGGVKLVGIVLIHPYFGGKEPIGAECGNLSGKAKSDELWDLVCPSSSNGLDDPWINPDMDPKLSNLGCTKVLVFVAEKDLFRDRGLNYRELLKKSGWRGLVEVMEAQGEDKCHCFHLANSTSDEAVAMLNRVAAFMNED